MDTLKIFMGITMALLVGALIVLAGRMKDHTPDKPEDELANLRQEIAELDREIERMKLEKERRLLRSAIQNPVAATQPKANETSPSEMAMLQEKYEQLEKEVIEANQAADLAKRESSFFTENHARTQDKESRRAYQINQATLIATIQQWVDDPVLGGGFAILNVEQPDRAEEGTVLAIRRNGGILGKLRIDDVSIDGIVANPMGEFGPIPPQTGDELIMNEVVEFAN